LLQNDLVPLTVKKLFKNLNQIAMSVNQKYALITGATSGIGYELAKLFAKDQYNLVIVARSQEELSTKATELRQQGIEVLPIAKDPMRKEAPYLVRY
jgi:short-subunit dehydrogenase